MKHVLRIVALLSLAIAGVGAQTAPGGGRLTKDGIARASAIVDSVFVDRRLLNGTIDGGDWASYLLARLGAGKIPDSLGIEVAVDSTHIEVRGRLQDLPLETRALLGPIASMVDSSTAVVATVLLTRTGPEIARFYLRSISVNGFPFPEFLLGSMMAKVGRQYPALTQSGRDLYVQVPADATIVLTRGGVYVAAPAKAGSARGSAPPSRR
ncbi:MAG: hypothetical protein ABI647_01910 [Gemmatimonadota bacterium]